METSGDSNFRETTASDPVWANTLCYLLRIQADPVVWILHAGVVATFE